MHWARLLRFGIPCDACDIEQHTTLVSNDPGIVPRRHMEDVTRSIFHLGAIIHPYRHPSLKDHAGMGCLARIGSCNRFYVQAPAPARLKFAAAHGVLAKRKDGHPACSILEWADFVRLIQGFLF